MGGSRKQVVEARRAREEKCRAASPALVAAGFREAFHRGPIAWLDTSTQEHSDAENFLRKMTTEDRRGSRDLVAQLAGASAFLHCADSWTLLGRAIDAITMGSLAEAAHLAYYAEVRAAISMMARSGLLVVGSQVVSVTDNGIETINSGGSTHTNAWDFLEIWSATPAALSTVARQVQFRGQPLDRWLEAARPNGASSALASFFTESWGADLKAMRDDRDRRNIASYHPSGFSPADPDGYSTWCADVVASLVEPLGPGAPGTFPDLDSAIVIQVLGHLAADGDRESWIQRAVTSVTGSSYGSDEVARGVVEALRHPHNSCVSAAMEVGPVPVLGLTRGEVKAMLSRALLLARFATGASRSMQREAGLDPEDFRWWSDHVGTMAGYWDPLPRPEPMTDLWQDLEAGLEDLDALSTGNPRGSLALRHQAPWTVRELSGLGRAGLWSLSA